MWDEVAMIRQARTGVDFGLAHCYLTPDKLRFAKASLACPPPKDLERGGTRQRVGVRYFFAEPAK